ncbi:CRTAC1 family protein [Aestuariibacter salexigens]|uniref:CRTAC1 family protein n=1 Tax=Aestuariibacter salexigens TaxID=226010 RepID=UPI00054E8254|nr:CRTAC1 family protein [Aestuariibacter salexigens]
MARVTFLRSSISTAVVFALLGCGGGGDASPTPVPTPSPAPAPAPTPTPPPPPSGYTLTAVSNSNELGRGGCGDNTSAQSSVFVDVTASAGLCYDVATDASDSIPARVGGGIAVNDIDNDGDLDIYVTHGRNENGKLFTLNTSFAFDDATQASGIRVLATNHSAGFIDIDRDGDQDLVTMLEAEPYIQFFANQGEQRFDDISHLVDIEMSKDTYSMAAGDIDADGDLDLFFTHWHPENEQHSREFLWQRTGPGQYEDVSEVVELEPFDKLPAGSTGDEFSFTPIFADINEDRLPDLLIAADWGTSQYLVNNGSMQFIDDTIPVVVSDRAGMGAATADYDNDGDIDWFVSAIGDTREEFLTIGLFDGNRLYQNDGNGNFLNMTDYAGVRQGYWAWGSCFADVNNDGFADLFVVNGYNGWTEEQTQSGNFDHFMSTPAKLYMNNGDGTFTERTQQLGITHTDMGRGLVCYDYDRDGDIDLLIANSGKSPTLYRNDSAAEGNHFANIRLTGTRDNPQGVGARITLKAGELTLTHEMQLGGLYVSQNPVEAHFGLARHTQIDEIRVQWPETGVEDTVITDIAADHFIVIDHPLNND